MAKKETKKPEKEPKVKETKDKKGKKNKNADAAAPAGGIPVTGTPSQGVPTGAIPNAGQQSVPLSSMSPDQMTMTQIEQAIKESNDPESRLKRLRSPFNVRSCLLNILILIVLTLGIVILWCFLEVDKFNFGTVFSDMMEKSGIAGGFRWLWQQISGWFS